MDAFERLMQVFVDPAGQLLWPVADVEHILPWCLVHMPVEMSELDEDTVELFARTCKKAGVKDLKDVEAVRAGLDAWYEQNPPNRALAAALEAAWKEVNAAAAIDKNPFAKFSGSAGPVGVLGGGERPMGTTPGGPLARLAAVPPTKKPRS